MRFPRLLQVNRYITFAIDVEKKIIRIPTVIHSSDGEAMNAIQVILCPKFSWQQLKEFESCQALVVIRIFRKFTFVYGKKSKTTA